MMSLTSIGFFLYANLIWQTTVRVICSPDSADCKIVRTGNSVDQANSNGSDSLSK